MTKYNSPFSVGHRKTVVIDSKDPRVNSESNLDKTRARIGADVEIVNTKIPIELETPPPPTDAKIIVDNYYNDYQNNWGSISFVDEPTPPSPYYSKKLGTFQIYAKNIWISYIEYLNGSGNSYEFYFAYSDDGVVWNRGAATPSSGKIIYEGGKFVALLGHQSAISYNGINWTFGAPFPIDYDYFNFQGLDPQQHSWVDLTYGNGKYVAISGDGYAAYSYDGLNWQFGTMANWNLENQFLSGWPASAVPTNSFPGPYTIVTQLPADAGSGSSTQQNAKLCFFSFSKKRFGPQYSGGTGGNNTGFSNIAFANGKFIIKITGGSGSGFGGNALYKFVSEDGEIWRCFLTDYSDAQEQQAQSRMLYSFNDNFWIPSYGSNSYFNGQPIEILAPYDPATIPEGEPPPHSGPRGGLYKFENILVAPISPYIKMLATTIKNQEVWALGSIMSPSLYGLVYSDHKIWRSSDSVNWILEADFPYEYLNYFPYASQYLPYYYNGIRIFGVRN